MLGITTPDAIAFGTLVIALLAAWKGQKVGEAAKRADPITPASPNTYKDLELLAQSMSLLTGIATKLLAVLERLEERHDRDDEVQKELNAREMKLLVDQLKHDRRP